MTTDTANTDRGMVIRAGLGGTALSIVLFLATLRLLSWIVEVREVELTAGAASALSALAFVALCLLPSLCGAAIAYFFGRSREQQSRRKLILRSAVAPLTLIPMVLAIYVIVIILSGQFQSSA